MRIDRRLLLLTLPVALAATTSLACLGASKLQKAQTAQSENDLTTALTLYTEIIDDGKAEADDVAAHAGRADVYIAQESWDAALADLNTVLTAQPENYEAMAKRGSVHLKMQHFAEAIADLKAGLAGQIANNKADLANTSKTDLYNAYYDLGGQQGDLGDNTGAVESYTAALDYTESAKNRADVFAQRGFYQSQLNNNEAAMADFNTAIDLDPTLAIAYAYRSSTQSDLGDDDAALADADKALELGDGLSNTMRSTLLHARALAYLNRGEYQPCITDATASIELILAADPGDTARTYNIRASCHLYSDDYAAAIEDATQAIAVGSEDVVALPLFYAKRARAYWYNEQLDEALADANIALDLDQTDASIFNLRGDLYYDKQDYTTAAADYQSAMNLEADNPLYATNLGYAHRQNEDYEAALNAYTEAINIDGSYADAWIGRGMTNYLLNNDAEARADLETALTLDISDDDRDFINEKLSEIP